MKLRAKTAEISWDRWFWGIAAVVVLLLAITWKGESRAVAVGDQATVNHRGAAGAWLATDDDAWDQLLDSENAGSGPLLGDLTQKGLAFREPNGSQVLVMRCRPGACFVRIDTGANKGQSGWIQEEFLSPAH